LGNKKFGHVIFALQVTAGIFIGIGTVDMQQGWPTPLPGLWERICIFAFMFWIGVFSVVLLQIRETEYYS
jgi:hypothetical protein